MISPGSLGRSILNPSSLGAFLLFMLALVSCYFLVFCSHFGAEHMKNTQVQCSINFSVKFSRYLILVRNKFLCWFPYGKHFFFFFLFPSFSLIMLVVLEMSFIDFHHVKLSCVLLFLSYGLCQFYGFHFVCSSRSFQFLMIVG